MTELAWTVLLVDDDRDLVDSLSAALGGLGYRVRSAGSGPEALSEFARETPDLVLLDLRLPGMDGIEVCRTLKDTSGDSFVPVLFLTALADLPTKVEALRAGGDDFCVKPVALPELDARMRVLLRARGRDRMRQTETEAFRRVALIDPLTGLGNRRAFEAELERAWARTQRSGKSLALLVADLDRFKLVNDTHGHRMGDEVLVRVGRAIEGAVRKGDSAFRFGGEELAVVAQDTLWPGAVAIAERVRAAVAAEAVGPPLGITLPAPLHVTVSIGVAVAPHPAVPTAEALLEAADLALYDAKATGRNRVALAALGPSVAPAPAAATTAPPPR